MLDKFIRPCALLVCTSVCASGAWAQADRIAIMPMEAVNIESQVRNNVVNLNKYSVEPAQQTRDAVIAAKDLGIDCQGADPKCLAGLGRLSGLSRIIVAEYDDKTTKLTLTSISVAGASVEQSVTRDLGPVNDQAGNIRVTVLELLDPAALNGRAFIGTGNIAAEVFVDGTKVGTAPLDEPLSLSPGPHQLRIVADGYDPFESEINVGIGQDVQVQANLTKPTAGGEAGGISVHPVLLIGSVIGGLMLTAGVVLAVGGVGVALANEAQLWDRDCYTDFGAIISGDPRCQAGTATPETQRVATTSWIVGASGAGVALTGVAVAAAGITVGTLLDDE